MVVVLISFKEKREKTKSVVFFFFPRNTLGLKCLSAYLFILIKNVYLKKTKPQTNSNCILNIIWGEILQKEWLNIYKGDFKSEATSPKIYVTFRYGRKTKAASTLINKMVCGLFFTPEITQLNVVCISSLLKKSGLTDCCNQSRLPCHSPGSPISESLLAMSVDGIEYRWSQAPD